MSERVTEGDPAPSSDGRGELPQAAAEQVSGSSCSPEQRTIRLSKNPLFPDSQEHPDSRERPPRPWSAVALAGAWIFSILCLAPVILPRITGNVLSGWDMQMQLYVSERLLGYLAEGRLSGYNPFWFGGYPELTLYPFLTYLLLQLPHILSFGSLTTTLSFNLVVAICPFVFLYAFSRAAGRLFGRGSEPVALLIGLLYLFLPRDVALSSAGLMGLFQVGYVPAGFGLAFALLFLSSLEDARQQRSPWSAARAGTWLGLTILCHHISAFYCLWMLGFFLIFRPGLRTATLAVLGLVAAGISGIWLIPALFHLGYSATYPTLLPVGGRDPLAMLFPGVSSANFTDLIAAGSDTGEGGLLQLLIAWPLVGSFSLILGAIGGYTLIRRRDWFVPISLVAALLILPRTLLWDVAGLQVRIPRAFPLIFVLHFLCCTVGAAVVIRALGSMQPRLLGMWLRTACVASFLALMLVVTWLQYPVEVALGGARGLPVLPTVNETSEYGDLKKLLAAVAARNPAGRTICESTNYGTQRSGMPHLCTFIASRDFELEVYNGLFPESALTSMFVTATIAPVSRNVLWGSPRLLRDRQFRSQPADTMWRRLEFMNVQHVIAASDKLKKSLEATPRASLVDRQGEFSLYELPAYASRVAELTGKPVLFVDGGGVDFREFSARWYSHPPLLDFPVVNQPEMIQQLPSPPESFFSAVVVSMPESARSPEVAARIRDLRRNLGASEIPLIVLGPLKTPEQEGLAKQHTVTIPMRSPRIAFETLDSTLRAISAPPLEMPLTYRYRNERIVFHSRRPVLVRYSYAPGWKSASPVFQAAPNFMLVFGRGYEELTYR